MKYSVLAFVFVLAASLLAVPAFAEQVAVSVSPGELKSDVDMNNVFEVTVTNNQPDSDLFKIIPYGPYMPWMVVPSWLIDLGASETKVFNLTVFPTGNRYGRFPHSIAATSISDPSVSSLASFYLDVEPVRINGITLSKSGSALHAEMDADSLKRRDISFSISLRDGDKVIASSSFDKQIDGTQKVSGDMTLPANLLAGNYMFFVEATTEGTTIKKSQSFILEPVHDVFKTRAESDTFMYKEITITLKNRGNVVENGYSITESTSPGQLTGFITAPAECTSGKDSNSCNYVISGLMPGATAQVVYRLEYWPTLMQYAGAGVVVLALLGFTFVHKTKPTIRKRSAALGGGKHSIIIEIKNPFLHHLNNVVVRDFVHPIAEVVHEEIESLKPVIRKTEAGTELIWKLGDIKPKETRLLKYGVKSVFQGDSVSSPKAYVRFMNPKGKSFRFFSNEL